jgi:hypothetical protein
MMYSADFIFIHVPRTGGTSLTNIFGVLPGVSKDVHFLKHAKASEIKRIIDEDVWNNAYKFSIYRENEEIAKSWYKHLCNCDVLYKKEKPIGVTKKWLDFVECANSCDMDYFFSFCSPPTMEYYLDEPEIDIISWSTAYKKLSNILKDYPRVLEDLYLKKY